MPYPDFHYNSQTCMASWDGSGAASGDTYELAIDGVIRCVNSHVPFCHITPPLTPGVHIYELITKEPNGTRLPPSIGPFPVNPQSGEFDPVVAGQTTSVMP